MEPLVFAIVFAILAFIALLGRPSFACLQGLLAAPPTSQARLEVGRRILKRILLKQKSYSLVASRTVLGIARFMEDYLGVCRCTNRLYPMYVLFVGSSKQVIVYLMRSQSGRTMANSTFAADAAKIASTLEQIKTQVFPTGVSSGSMRLAIL